MDDTELCLRSLPDKSLSIHGYYCTGGKKSKDSFVVCKYMDGEIEKHDVLRSDSPMYNECQTSTSDMDTLY